MTSARGLVALLAAFCAAGCATQQMYISETFESAPEGWLRRAQDGVESPALLSPARGRLELEGTHVLVQDFVFLEPFRGIVDLALGGGELGAFAGVFIEEIGATGADLVGATHCLAVNERGEWIGYDGATLSPFGTRAWSRFKEISIAAPLRFTVRVEGGNIEIGIAGESSAMHRVRARVMGADPASGYRVGVFASSANVAFDNVIVGEDSPSGLFDPAVRVRWGLRDDGEALLRLAIERAEAFRRAPRRASLLGVAEAFASAREVFAQNADENGLGRTTAAVFEFLDSSRAAIDRVQADELARGMIEYWQLGPGGTERLLGEQSKNALEKARVASEAGRLAESLVLSTLARVLLPSSVDETTLEALREKVGEPLTLSLAIERDDEVENGDDDGRLRALSTPRAEVTTAAINEYGRVPRSSDAALRIRFDIVSATLAHDQAPATRRVIASASTDVITPEQRDDLARLEKQFADDLLDARGRALSVRASRISQRMEIDLRTLEFEDLGARAVEVHVSDIRSLQALAKRIRSLRELARAGSISRSSEIMIDAESVTDVARFAVAYAVELDGIRVLEGDVKAVEGLEQWIHESVSEGDLTVPEATYDAARGAEVVKRARDRLVRRLRNAISRESLFGKLDGDAASALLIRIARATGARDDLDLLQWHLKNAYGIGTTRAERVARALTAR